MKRPLSITLFWFFAIWGTLKAFESLLKTAGTQEVYAFYSLVWLYYVITIFTGIAGLALIYGLWKAKPWVAMLGTVWLGVGIVRTVFNGLVSYFNKPLMIQIFTDSLAKRGRETANAVGYINSSAYDMVTLGSSTLLIVVMGLFIWKLWQYKSLT